MASIWNSLYILGFCIGEKVAFETDLVVLQLCTFMILFMPLGVLLVMKTLKDECYFAIKAHKILRY